MPPTAKKAATPVAPPDADKTSEDVGKASKRIAKPQRTSIKTGDGVEIGWTEG